MHTLQVRSNKREVLIDVTEPIRDAVRGWTCTAVLIYVPHTTAGVLINEHADPDVSLDLLKALEQMVPTDPGYRHAEGNSVAHVKAVLVGTSQNVPLRNGDLLLGTWQGVFLAEFDGPRTRSLFVVPTA